MSEYKIDEQEWKSWPKAVMMRRDWTTNGHDHRKEVRRYVPDDESETLRREVNRLRSTIKCLESRLRNSYRSDRRLDKWAERLRGRIHDIARDRDKLTAENAKLRDELAQWERLMAGIELPEYPISEFQPKDIERENAKLRKIVREQAANIEGYSCNECPYNEECDLDTVPMHDGCRMYAEMRELGIEENG